MNYEILGKGGPARIAILTPRIQKGEILKHYFDPHLAQINEQVMVCDLYLNRSKKKTPAAEIKEYLEDLAPHLKDAGIELLVVNQPEYFKVLSKQAKTDATIGDILDGVGGFKVTYVPNYSRVFYDPDKTKARISHGLAAVRKWTTGSIEKTGTGIIKFAEYPSTTREKIDWLSKLIDMDCDLTCDIEGFDLKHYDARYWDNHLLLE